VRRPHHAAGKMKGSERSPIQIKEKKSFGYSKEGKKRAKKVREIKAREKSARNRCGGRNKFRSRFVKKAREKKPVDSNVIKDVLLDIDLPTDSAFVQLSKNRDLSNRRQF
jgi:hypothetical protein